MDDLVPMYTRFCVGMPAKGLPEGMIPVYLASQVDAKLAKLRAALERVCNVDKASPGRRDCDIWAQMIAEAADALRSNEVSATAVTAEKDNG